MTARWEQVLDSIERDAGDAVRRFTSTSSPSVDDEATTTSPSAPTPDAWMPEDLGPLPSHLEERARAVLACVDAAHDRLRHVPRPTVEPGRTRFASSAHGAAVTFDRTI